MEPDTSAVFDRQCSVIHANAPARHLFGEDIGDVRWFSVSRNFQVRPGPDAILRALRAL